MGMLFPVRLMKNSWLLQPPHPPMHTPLQMRPCVGPRPLKAGSQALGPGLTYAGGGRLFLGRKMPLVTSGWPLAPPLSSPTQAAQSS